MAQYSVFQAKTQLSRLLRKVEQGEDVIIVNRNRPVARIVPIQAGKRTLGSLKGKITISEDFDEPLKDFEEYMK